MAITEVSIANSALIKIGAERIASFSEDNKRAIAISERYAMLRDEVLADHPWNFALRRADLAEVLPAPTWGYAHQFNLPEDCLRVIKTQADEEAGTPWKVEGELLLTDASDAKILYVAAITDASSFSPKFAEALSLRIAADLAYHLVQSAPLQAQMMEAYARALSDAKQVDAQEGTPDDFDADYWLRSRF